MSGEYKIKFRYIGLYKMNIRKREADLSSPSSAEDNIASVGITKPTLPYALTGAQG
jgi:hypothetical protein